MRSKCLCRHMLIPTQCGTQEWCMPGTRVFAAGKRIMANWTGVVDCEGLPTERSTRGTCSFFSWISALRA